MIGRLDLVSKPCKYCKESGRDPKNRKRTCPECNGSKNKLYCSSCGDEYGTDCVDVQPDQTYCSQSTS